MSTRGPGDPAPRAARKRKPPAPLTGSRGDSGRGSQPTVRPTVTIQGQPVPYGTPGRPLTSTYGDNQLRARAIRRTRAQVTPATGSRGDTGTGKDQPYTKPQPQRPLSSLDVLSRKTGTFVPNDAQINRARRHTVQAGVAHLLTTGRSLHKQEATIERLRQLGAAPGTSEFQHAVDRFRASQKRPQSASDVFLTDPADLKAAGFRVSKADQAAQLPGRILPTLGASFLQTGLATLEHPLQVIPKTAGGLAKSVVGAPAGLVEAAVNPQAAAKAIVADYTRRYGDVIKDPKAFRARIVKEGATGEVLDLATTLGLTGVTAGRVGQKIAEARGVRLATERPTLRVSGNTVREQPLSDNLIRNVARAGVDKGRAVVQARRVAREDAPLEVRQAQAEGSVTYARRGKQAKVQRVAVAREKGVSVAQLKREQQQELKHGREQVGTLNDSEKRGLKTAMDLGARTPEGARTALKLQIDLVKAHRADHPNLKISRRRDALPQLQWLHDHADEVFTPNLDRVARDLQSQERRQVTTDPGVDPVQAQLRRSAAQAKTLGIERGTQENVAKRTAELDRAQARVTRLRDTGAPAAKQTEAMAARDAARSRLDALKVDAGESHGQYLRRVARARRHAGLERPGYFPSEERPQGVFSTMAHGGQKATDIPKAYQGKLLERGTESHDPEVAHRGIMRNVKRKQQWNFVGRQFEQHSAPSVPDRVTGEALPTRNKTIHELTTTLENAGIDPSTVGFWNPRRFYAASQSAAKHDAAAGDALGQDVTQGASDVHSALVDATVTPKTLATRSDAFKATTGWSIVPKSVLDELESQTRTSGLPSRVVDVSRGKVSRVLLGNPAWLSIQVGSNILMTGLAGAGPITAIKAQRWWAKLPADVKAALEPELGIHGWYDEQTHLGAATNNRFINAYRGFKQTGLYSKAHTANPLDAIFRADNAQNNFFRKTVAYNEATKAAYKRMGDSSRGMIRGQLGIQNILRKPSDLAVLDALRHPEIFERHAEKVRDFLGDYMTYTARERRTLGRYAMFYGFLRNSLRMAFYTMPVKHPVMTAIGLELGKMHDDELQKIFGAGNVPAWEQGNAFIGGKKFPLARLNPFFNAIQYQGPGSLMQIGSPFLSIAADQIAGKNVAFDRLWKTKGSTQYVISGKDVGVGDRARIALAELLHLSPIERAAERTGIPGVAQPLVGAQSDTSSLPFPEPTRYKQGPAVARNAARVADEQSKGVGQILQEQFFPLAGTPSKQTISSAVNYARSQGRPVPGDAGAAPITPAQARALARARRASHGAGAGTQARALARARRAAARAGGR